MHGGPPSEVVRHLYYYNTLEPGVQSAAPDDLHHHHPLPAVVAMDPSGGRDSRYNLNYSMSIGLNMAEGGGGGSAGVQDMYGNPASLVRPGMSMNNSRSLMGGPNNNNNNNNNNSSTSCLSNNSPVGGGGSGQSSGQRGIKRTNSDCFDDRAMGSNQQQQQQQQLGQSLSDGLGVGGVGGGVVDVVDDSSYASSLQKKSPPANGKKTKGRVKIKMEYIDNKLRRYTTFSKRKTGIMKKVSERGLFFLLFNL